MSSRYFSNCFDRQESCVRIEQVDQFELGHETVALHWPLAALPRGQCAAQCMRRTAVTCEWAGNQLNDQVTLWARQSASVPYTLCPTMGSQRCRGPVQHRVAGWSWAGGSISGRPKGRRRPGMPSVHYIVIGIVIRYLLSITCCYHFTKLLLYIEYRYV